MYITSWYIACSYEMGTGGSWKVWFYFTYCTIAPYIKLQLSLQPKSYWKTWLNLWDVATLADKYGQGGRPTSHTHHWQQLYVCFHHPMWGHCCIKVRVCSILGTKPWHHSYPKYYQWLCTHPSASNPHPWNPTPSLCMLMSDNVGMGSVGQNSPLPCTSAEVL